MKTLVILVLGALPLHCIGNPIAEHNMAEMAQASGALTPLVLGSVSFQTSCKPQVKKEFNRAVALLHSFWLDEAERTFKAVAKRDPSCAMAQWGVAMTNFNQVNGGPTPAGVVAANQALAKADVAREKSAREAVYIGALHSFFDGYVERDFQTYAERYAGAMAKVAAAYPSDLEAQVFYALALINSEPRDDVALANKKKAVAILYPLFRAHPNHPGIAHYIIHACDNPVMAQEGIIAAVRYAAIAPAAPHALHMPSHIFMRLGLWRDDIRSNLASKTASEDPAVHVGAEARLHAMEFLEYAYLQSGHYSQAAAIVAEAKTVRESDVDPRFPHYYSIVEALYPALFAIETQDWATAAKLKLEGPNWFTQAQALLAHAVAAGHLHDPQAGKAAAEALETSVAQYLMLRAGASNATLPDEIRAWARFAQGDLPGAVTLLQPVADRQDKLGEGGIEVPAREMLADMLFLNGQFAEALHEYQGVLASDPNRFNALLAAGRVAEELGERDVAVNYYRTLLANCPGADGSALVSLHHPQTVVDEMAVRPASGNASATANHQGNLVRWPNQRRQPQAGAHCDPCPGRGLCDSARVWVGQNDGLGVLLERLLHDLPRVDRCSVDRALEHLLIAKPIGAQHRGAAVAAESQVGSRTRLPDPNMCRMHVRGAAGKINMIVESQRRLDSRQRTCENKTTIRRSLVRGPGGY